MIAKYKGRYYKANLKKEEVTIFSSINADGFEHKHDYWYKKIDIIDDDLTDIFEKHYFVEYLDSIEEKTIWNVNIEKSVFLTGNPVNYEVVINVDHYAKDNTWQNYDKYASGKVICLKNCKRCFVETVWYKQDGKIHNITKSKDVDVETFRNDLYFINKTGNFNGI